MKLLRMLADQVECKAIENELPVHQSEGNEELDSLKTRVAQLEEALANMGEVKLSPKRIEQIPMGDGTLQEFNARIKALEVHVRSEMMKKAKET
jgi:hypothetical protein